MPLAEHKIAILSRITMPEAGIELVCNNPTDTIRFEFDEEWSGIAAKTARFSWDGKYKDVPFSGNMVEVPEIYQTNHVYVGVFADNIASTPAKVKCRYSIKCLGGKVVPPSEDVYAEIIALINAGINANDGVGVSSAFLGEDGHLFITLTTGESIDCGKAQGKDGKDGKDGAGAEEFATVQECIAENKEAIEQNAADIETLETNLDAFEKKRPFDLTGNPIQFETFEGMPLNPVTVLTPQQSGSGDPSSENIRPFIGYDTLGLNHHGEDVENTLKAYTVQIGQTVYGIHHDWLSGKDWIDWGLYTLTGEGSAKLLSASVYNDKCFMSDVIPNMAGNSDALNGAMSSHFIEDVWNIIVNTDAPFGKFAVTTSNKVGIAFDGTIEEANAWLAAQHAAGTPVQIVYKLATPIELDPLTPTEILALQGVNTLYGDGEITISGRSDMQAVVSNLMQRIAALEATINS